MNRFTKYQGEISDARPQIGGDLFGIMVLVILLGIFSLSGCQDSFMKQTTADKTSAIASLTSEVDAAGNVTATFDPNNGQTQVLKLASGALAGSAVAIPPGSLAIPVSITVGEGETLASSTFTQQIGLTDNSVTAAGPSVSFIPSTNVQASSPLTLSLPFSLTSLALAAVDTENVIVMFRSIKVDGDQTSYEMGVIPRSEVTISSDKVSFQTKQFGVFQLAKTEKKITQRVVQPTIEVPVMKKEAGNPLLGAWESCRVDGESVSNDSGSATGGATGIDSAEPLKWMNVASNGDFDSQGKWTSKVSLNWSGGLGPYRVSRYTISGCSGDRPDVQSLPNNHMEDTNLSTAEMVYYQLTDSQSKVSECQPVQVITKPEKIRWSSVEYGTATVTASWEGPGQTFNLLTYPESSCQGSPAYDQTSMKSYNFNLTSVRSVQIRVFNSPVRSSCLNLNTVQSFLPSLGGGANFITSVLIKSPATFGGDSSVVVKFAAASGVSYTASRFNSPGCADTMVVKSINPIITNGTVGTIEDVIQASDLGPNQSPSYELVQSVQSAQSGTTSLSQCVNFLPIDNRNPALRIYSVISNPTSVEFKWTPEVVGASNVELFKHVGDGCASPGIKLPLDPPGTTPGQKIGSLDQSSYYSFKLKTTDDSAPYVCFNATTTDGELPSSGNKDERGDIGALGSVPGRTYSRLNKLKIGKDAYIMRQDVFPSKDCTGFPVSSNTEQGVFALPAIDVEGTIPIDVTQKDLDGAIFTQEGVDIANKRPLEFGCGLSGWVKGVVRKLSDSKKCGDVGRTYYERLKVDGDRLYMCSSGPNKDYGSTPDMRAPSCDITSDMEYFTRQK